MGCDSCNRPGSLDRVRLAEAERRRGTSRVNRLLSCDSVTSATQTATATRYILIAIALLAIAAIFWTISDVLVIGFGAIVFAAVLRSIVLPIVRVTHWSERLTLVLVVLLLMVIFGLLFWLFGKQAANQFTQLQEQLPAAIDKARDWIAANPLGRIALDSFKTSAEGGGALGSAGTALGATAGGVANVLVIIFAGVYLAADPSLYRNGALRLLPPSRRAQVGHAIDDAALALRKWLVAQIIVMVAVGLMSGIGLALLGVPLSLLLGLLAGLLEFVPVVGPIAAGIPAVLLGFTKGPETAVYVLILYVAIQQIESNILTPLIQRWAVELPPVIALLSIVAFGLLFGPMGVIFATPMTVVVMAMVQHLYVEDTLENGRAEPKPAGRKSR
jgi:predicted PurR-regulated permease PerM